MVGFDLKLKLRKDLAMVIICGTNKCRLLNSYNNTENVVPSLPQFAASPPDHFAAK